MVRLDACVLLLEQRAVRPPLVLPALRVVRMPKRRR
jgi:hypothetical protein